jgi:hypothetical protein
VSKNGQNCPKPFTKKKVRCRESRGHVGQRRTSKPRLLLLRRKVSATSIYARVRPRPPPTLTQKMNSTKSKILEKENICWKIFNSRFDLYKIFSKQILLLFLIKIWWNLGILKCSWMHWRGRGREAAQQPASTPPRRARKAEAREGRRSRLSLTARWRIQTYFHPCPRRSHPVWVATGHPAKYPVRGPSDPDVAIPSLLEPYPLLHPTRHTEHNSLPETAVCNPARRN